MTEHFDYCILGAGLAGVSLAHELSKRNRSVCLIDPNGVAGGASGTPLGLVNPATGRYATLSWEAEKCYSAIESNLELIQKYSRIPFYRKSGVLRPALDEKIATKMKSNFEATDWPQRWCSWMNETELKQFHPWIECIGGGVWLPIGLTVDMASYLNSFVDFLSSRNVECFFDMDYSVEQNQSSWTVQFDNGSSVRTESIVYTNGIEANEVLSGYSKKMTPVKGQLAVLESNTPLSFKHAVSALGYITSLSEKTFVVGSTYEHTFEHAGIDEKGLNYLIHRFENVLPNLKGTYKVLNQWSGIRASTPNRKPLMGKLKDIDSAFIFSGLGSKGLLYSAYLALLMSEYLLDGTPLERDMDIQRLEA